MHLRLYIDTSIWMDFFEDREGYKGEPLGKYAWELLALVLSQDWIIVITDVLVMELKKQYSPSLLKEMFAQFSSNLERINSNLSQKGEARLIYKIRKIPFNDILHAIMARDNNLIFITRDRHFKRLKGITLFLKPEDFIEKTQLNRPS